MKNKKSKSGPKPDLGNFAGKDLSDKTMFLYQPETLDFKNGAKLTCLKAKEGEKIRGLTIDLPIVDF